MRVPVSTGSPFFAILNLLHGRILRYPERIAGNGFGDSCLARAYVFLYTCCHMIRTLDVEGFQYEAAADTLILPSPIKYIFLPVILK